MIRPVTFAAVVCRILAALLIGGILAAIVAYLIGLPVLRLKSDYLAIATLGFAEIIRLLRESNQKFGQTVMIVTHDENVAKQTDRIIEICDGRIVRDERLI